MGNQLAGSEKMKRPSIRVHENLLDEFDEWVDQSEYDGRSAAVRAFMKQATGGTPEGLTPLQPPTEDRLADAYRNLCKAGYPNGKVREQTALRLCSGGPNGIEKSEVPHMVLHPLRRRGYLQRWNGHPGQRTPQVVWEIVGWDTK